jgi:hypothetical protein
VTGYTMEIGNDLPARNVIYLHPQITVGIQQNSYLSNIKAFSMGIKQLDDEINISISPDVKLKKCMA